MKEPVIIKTEGGEEMVLNEAQVCTIESDLTDLRVAIITMSSGQVIRCISHPYHMWVNDEYKRVES